MPKVQGAGLPSVSQQGLNLQGGRDQDRYFNDAQQSINKITEAGVNVGKAIQQKQMRDDEAAIKSNLTNFRRDLNARTYLDDDAYYKRKGLDAHDSYEPMNQELSDIKKQYSSSLKNGRQQNAFNAAAQEYIDRENISMSKHAAKENLSWHNSESEAKLFQDEEDGSLRWLDNSIYVNSINAELDKMAARNGWGPEETKLKKLEATTKMHANAIDNILSDAPNMADDYLEIKKDQIAPSAYDDLKLKVKKRVDAQWAIKKADEISSAGGSRAEQLEKVTNSTQDPSQRELIKSQVVYNFNQAQRAKSEASAEAYNQADLEINDIDNPVSVASWQVTNPDLWESMTPGQRKSLGSSTSSRKFNPSSWNKVSDMIASGDTEEAHDYLRKNADLFTAGDYKSLDKELRDPYRVEAWASRTQRLNAQIEAMNLSDSQKGRMQNAMEHEYRIFQQKNKREPDANEQDQIIKSLITQHYDGDWVPFRGDVFGFDISENLNSKVNEFKNRFGRDPTDSELSIMQEILIEEAK